MAIDDADARRPNVANDGSAEGSDTPGGAEADSGQRGVRASDLAIVGALLLPLILIAGVLVYRATAGGGPAFECTPEHQALGHC